MSHTLLLADDSVTIQRVIELTFADEDIKVIAVSDGDQAIARLDASPPDIVLADIGMPGKNGYEVAQYIKRSPKLSKIPVVLLTGAFEPVDQARAAEAGCDGILAKPFEPQLVISRVKELLGAGPAKPAERDAMLRAASASAPQPAPPSEEAPRPSSRNTEEYFDRLDAAFTSAAAAPPPALLGASKPTKSGAAQEAASVKQDDMDLPIATSSAPPVDLPLSVAPPPAAAPAPPAPQPPAPAAATVATVPAAVHPPGSESETVLTSGRGPAAAPDDRVGDNDATRPVVIAAKPPAPMPAQPIEIPALADAFAALLAAEQAEPLPPSVPTWPASGPPTDVIAEHVVRRVLDQMSDRVVRETVTALVTEVTERLVREEI